MVENIFGYIVNEIGEDDSVSISYETIKDLFLIDFQEFQQIALDYSSYYGLISSPTKDDIGFIRRDRMRRTKN